MLFNMEAHQDQARYLRLSNGVAMPLMGIGTASLGGYSHEAMVHALRHCAIRHIDTARKYKCEHRVGLSVAGSGVPRDELFVTSKAWPSDYGYDRVTAAFYDSLKQVGVSYFDLYLLHWPNAPEGCDAVTLIKESWKALEELYSQGLCKSIGVSNFRISDLEELKKTWTVVPHVNQLEVHVFNYPEKLIKYCKNIGMQIVGYCPLARGHALTNPTVLEVAAKYDRPSSQIVNRWLIQHAIATIPKSTKCHRVEENCKVFDFSLSEEDMQLMDRLHTEEPLTVVNVSPSVFNQM